MTIYENMQEKGQKFKFSKAGVLYLNTFEVKKANKVQHKPYYLWKREEGKRIADKALAEINRAKDDKEPTFELVNGMLVYTKKVK